ncbi:transmembrane protein 119-like [Myxocyprinus asiaticus]|uniref:transmembrane protein 119-like n=1 Tax=Myxocyprinus asiaticus TaxID=70543 RepID=UPI0022231F47|nr:transmembrane protein 119-like [Myxocyprinus asiaticus]
MDHTVLCCLTGLSIILINSSGAYATPVIFNDSLEGSGQWESRSTDLIPTPSISSFLNESIMSTSINGEKHTKPLLNQVVDFLKKNLLLIVVITTLILAVFIIICLAAFLSRRRKVSTYYPCAFPSKMYVDERDKNGGARFFNEVPEKTNTSSSEEPLNSAKQLQEDIMLATKNLRTPAKAPWRERNEKVEDQKTDDEENPQSDKSHEENYSLQEDKNRNQSVVEDFVEKSQDSVPVCDMEKTDPSGSGPPDESKHPSGPENSEIQDNMNKQEVDTSGSPFISEEKTAF